MGTITYTTLANLVAGNPENVADVVDCFQKITAQANGNLDSAANIAAGGITDVSLASPTNPVWRTVLEAQCLLNGSIGQLTTGTFWFPRNVATAIQASGAGTTSSAEGLWVAPAAADEAVPAKTTRLRLRAVWASNATAPGINITWGLYPLTTGGASPAINYTLGTVIAGSTAVATTPGASSAGEAKSAGFDMSAVTAGSGYIIGVTGSGTQSATSVLPSVVFLEMRHT